MSKTLMAQHIHRERAGREGPVQSTSLVLLPMWSATTMMHRRHVRRRWTWALSVVVVIELISSALLFTWRQPVRQVNIAGLFSGRTIDTRHLAAQFARAEANYRLPIRYPDKTVRTFSLADMGMHIDGPATVAAAHAAQRGSLLHATEWWQTTFVPLSLTVDEQKFTDFLDHHVTFAAIEPHDARLWIENGELKTAEATPGQRYDLPGSAARLKTAAGRLDMAGLQPSATTTPAHITLAQLTSARQQAEVILAQKVTITIDGSATTVPRNIFGDWITFDPAPEEHAVHLGVDQDAVLGYINQLTGNYNHAPHSQVMATAEDGSVSVLITGQSGASVPNKSGAASSAADQLLKGRGVDVSMSVVYTPFKTITAQAYPKWIEVDATTKHLYAYEQTTLVRDVPISAGAAATPTVTGQFAIYAKYRSQTMSGPNADGTRYVQPNVPYINYFYQDYAIHGNYWRPASYFGNVNSSHGCVGARSPDDAWIYSWAPIGTPVIVHT